MGTKLNALYKCWACMAFVLIVLLCATTTMSEPPPAFDGGGALSVNAGAGNIAGGEGIPISSGLITPYLPKIPNLEFGFQYYFGNRVRTGRFSLDYVLPISLDRDSVLFAEARANGWGFWNASHSSGVISQRYHSALVRASDRVDLSFGGGYRRIINENTLIGINGFYDGTRLYNKWHSSGGLGAEMYSNLPGAGVLDLTFNWYGDLFDRDTLSNIFRGKVGNSFDFQTGYSVPVLDKTFDLRFKAIGYQFSSGDTAVRGWRTGTDLTTRDGIFTLRYEHGRDRLNGDYNTVGAFVTTSFDLAGILNGENPFKVPEPIYGSPRHLEQPAKACAKSDDTALRRQLGSKVKRTWGAMKSPVFDPCGGAGCILVTSEMSHNFAPNSNPLGHFAVDNPCFEGFINKYGTGPFPPYITVTFSNMTPNSTFQFSVHIHPTDPGKRYAIYDIGSITIGPTGNRTMKISLGGSKIWIDPDPSHETTVLCWVDTPGKKPDSTVTICW